MTELSGDLGHGVHVDAPGTEGRADLSDSVPPQTPGSQVFHQALDNAGFDRQDKRTIVMTHTTAATGDVTVRFPAPREGHNALLLVQDSTGIISWHKSTTPTPAARAFTGVDGPAGEPAADDSAVSFTIPQRRFDLASHAGALTRITGLLHHFNFHPDLSGPKKVVTMLEYPIAHLAAWGATKWIDAWDRNKHPSVIRWFPPADNLSQAETLSPTNWDFLRDTKGPVLLFIHGIFSSCNGAFGALDQDSTTWASLKTKYDDRIIGFDHPTVSVGPEQNAIDFLAAIPDGIRLRVDIVCHSRGGLVARALAGESTAVPAAALQKIDVQKIVFAATPNGGTPIADRTHWPALVDRICSLVTLPTAALPPPVDEVTSIVAGVLEILKAAAVDTEVELPGLAQMDPTSELYARYAATTGHSPTEYFAAASDFQPGALLANLFDKIDDLARVVDKAVFSEAPNDVAVPTAGVWDPGSITGPGGAATARAYRNFPIPDDHRLALGLTSVYWHSAYFEDPNMRAALLRWLAADAVAAQETQR